VKRIWRVRQKTTGRGGSMKKRKRGKKWYTVCKGGLVLHVELEVLPCVVCWEEGNRDRDQRRG